MIAHEFHDIHGALLGGGSVIGGFILARKKTLPLASGWECAAMVLAIAKSSADSLRLQSQLGLSPLLHGQKNGNEALASGREGVLDARGHLAEVRAGEEAVLDQFFELLGERGFGDIADAAAQLAEVAHIFQGDVEEDFYLPFPADHALDSRDRSAALDLLAAPLRHGLLLYALQKKTVLHGS